MGGKIFISYRRSDSPAATGRLFDQLEAAFGSDQVFMDVDNIRAGQNFVTVLADAVRQCDVLLAVIGPAWLDARTKTGERKLDRADDFVRIEIESALGQKKLIIPVLVNGAAMPSRSQLPESMQPLVQFQGIELVNDHFRSGVRRLEHDLRTTFKECEEVKERSLNPARQEEPSTIAAETHPAHEPPAIKRDADREISREHSAAEATGPSTVVGTLIVVGTIAGLAFFASLVGDRSEGPREWSRVSEAPKAEPSPRSDEPVDASVPDVRRRRVTFRLPSIRLATEPADGGVSDVRLRFTTVKVPLKPAASRPADGGVTIIGWVPIKSRLSPQKSTVIDGVDWLWSHVAQVGFTRSEVTVSQFRKCVDAGRCDRTHFRTSTNKQCNFGHPRRGNHPMNCVSLRGAKQYCRYVGGRLPTSAEWVAEAFDSGHRNYPWGDEAPSCEVAVINLDDEPACGKWRTWPVCSKAKDRSVTGLCDMGGSVSEWTSSTDSIGFALYYGNDWRHRIAKGPGLDLGQNSAPTVRADWVGIRCVRKSLDDR